MRYKKRFIALEDFKINQNFQSFVEKLNKRKTGVNQLKNTGGQGSCALQSFEIYYQMLHNQNGFKSVKYHFIEKEGFLDENFAKKNANLASTMRTFFSYKTLFFTMYKHHFLKARFLKTSNLRALLEKDEFFKVPIICSINCKVGVGHVNILYRDEKGLFVINTNESSNNKIKLIEAHNGDVFALENIAYNWTGEFENVKAFRLYIPYEKIEIKEKEEEQEEELQELQKEQEKEELRKYFKEKYKLEFNLNLYDFTHKEFRKALENYYLMRLLGKEEKIRERFLTPFLLKENDDELARSLKILKMKERKGGKSWIWVMVIVVIVLILVR